MGDRDHGRDRDRSERGRSTERDVLAICWKPVKEDPTNFEAWTHLLQCIEQMDETKPAREAYDEFLGRYPYCYGYWKKYADLEKRHRHMERAVEVFERGVAAIPLSVDLWQSYLAFYKDFVRDTEVAIRKTRYLYERAIGAAGLEFRSDKLWEDYVAWEMGQGNTQEALAIYDRAIKIPTLLYSNTFERLQDFVNAHPPDAILSDSEFAAYCAEIEAEVKPKGQEVYVMEEVEVPAQPANGDPEVKEEPGAPPPTRTEYRRKYSDEALKLFRVAIIDKRRKAHLFNEQEVSKRWNYEEAIKRPYFHVKPLERAQLKNWRAYLDFEVSEGSHERIVVLFERALIAAALYEDIWIRYARYMERKDEAAAREVYKRACGIHLTKKPNPHLAWSAFEEKLGRYDESKQILHDLEKVVPGLVVVARRRCGIERRQAIAKAAATSDQPDFSVVTARYEKLLRDPKLPTRVHSYYAIKFARFNAKDRKDSKLAEKVLIDAMLRDKSNPMLHTQLVEVAQSGGQVEDILAAFDGAIRSPHLADTDKVAFSARKLEWLEDEASDVGLLQEHFEAHQKLVKSTGVGRETKRKSEAGRSGGAPEDKRQRRDAPVAAAPAPANVYAYPAPTGYAPAAAYYPQATAQAYPAPQATYGYYATPPAAQVAPAPVAQ